MSDRRSFRLRRSGPDDRGVALLFFAISVTAMLAVGALVLGGSSGYSAVRSAQNAADAAALAGASTLRDHKANWVDTPATEVLATVESVVEANGAALEPGGCELVTADYALSNSDDDVVDTCDTLADLDDVEFKAVSGVRVTVVDERDVPFAAFVDRNTITAHATAAATIQAVRDKISAPFMLCANAVDHTPALVLSDDSVDPPYQVNPAAVGHEYLLWSNGNGMGDRNCGASQWHGLVNTDIEYQVPSDPSDDSTWWDVDTGSRVGQLSGVLAGTDACSWADDDPTDGCTVTLPLCIDSAGSGTNMRLDCVRMAVFDISFVGLGNEPGSCSPESGTKKVVCGVVIDGGVAAGGQGTTDPVDTHELVVIKLVQ